MEKDSRVTAAHAPTVLRTLAQLLEPLAEFAPAGTAVVADEPPGQYTAAEPQAWTSGDADP